MSKIWKNGVHVLLYDFVENIMGKEEIAHNEQFLLFPHCFQKLSFADAQNEYLWSKGLKDFLRVVKSQDCVVKSEQRCSPSRSHVLQICFQR